MIKFVLVALVLLCSTSYSQFTQTVVSLSGVTINAINGEAAKTEIIVYDQEGKKVNSTKSRLNEKGYYFLTGLKPNTTYKIDVSGAGYFKETFEVFIPNTDQYAELSKDFAVKPLAKGVKIPLKVIPFDLHKSKLRAGSDYLLMDMLVILKKNPKENFTIETWAEDTNNPNSAEIAQSRANEIKNFFLSKGVGAERVDVVAKSEYDPENPKPVKTGAKGKRYKGSIYFVVN